MIARIITFKVLYSLHKPLPFAPYGAIDISVPPLEESIVVIRSGIFIIFYSYEKYLLYVTIS
tara:strand:- start:504 stop:689 length:186 start_codon:yes stop_codon:yes gene_type:complete